METINKVQNNRYSREEKQKLILQWQQIGMTRKKFCEERSFNYYTFGGIKIDFYQSVPAEYFQSLLRK